MSETAAAATGTDIGFCQSRTDHIAHCEWVAGAGWSGSALLRHGHLELDPSALVLHYGQAIFEGLKVFRQPDGSAAMFRAADHARRMRLSARRLAMPEMPPGLFMAACAELATADDRWIPDGPGQGLYMRPLLIATEPGPGLHSSRQYRCVFLAYPAGPCFGAAFIPLSVLASGEMVRAVRGGTGEAKCAGNYAASLLARDGAIAQGHDEVLWLDALEHRWIEELSGMNVFCVWRDGGSLTLTTPPCQGSIVRGITRDSLLTLAPRFGLAVREEPAEIGTVMAGARSGRLAEMFACGTAAVVVAVGRITSAGEGADINGGGEGPVTARLRQALTGIQHGTVPDTHGWLMPVRCALTGAGRPDDDKGTR